MFFEKEIEEKIKVLFKDDELMREKLLSGDTNAIRELSVQKMVKPEDVVKAIESNNPETMNCLYEQCKKIIEIQKLYRELCLEYYKKISEEQVSNNQRKNR